MLRCSNITKSPRVRLHPPFMLTGFGHR